MGTTLGLVTLMDIVRSISTATIGTTESVSQFSLKPFKWTSVTSNLGSLGQILYNTPRTTTIATMANNMASNTSVFFFFFLLCVLESRTLTSVFFFVPETRTLPPSSFSSSSSFFLTQPSCIPPPKSYLLAPPLKEQGCEGLLYERNFKERKYSILIDRRSRTKKP